jgi:hypothetical protein
VTDALTYEWFVEQYDRRPELARVGITVGELRAATFAVSVINFHASTPEVFETRHHASVLLASQALYAAARERQSLEAP